MNLLTSLKHKVTIKRTFELEIVSGASLSPLKESELRDYQTEAAKMALYHRRGVIKLPTASGKTLIAAAIIKTARRRALFLTNKIDILYQTAKVLRREIGPNIVGIVGDQEFEPNIVTVAMIPTLYNHRKDGKYLDILEDTVVMIGDEIHHAKAKTWYKVMQMTPAQIRIGLSATPTLGEAQVLLEAACGPIIYTARPRKLIKEGYISEPHICILKTYDDVRERADYQEAYETGVVEAENRNRLIVKICKALRRNEDLTPIVIQCRKLRHIRKLVKMLNSEGIAAIGLKGADSADKRITTYSRIEKSRIEVMVVSSIFDEGVDVTNIRSLIIAAGGKSDRKTIQRLGRGLRRTKEKSDVLVVDFYDTSCDYLSDHSKKRVRTYKAEGYNVRHFDYHELLDKIVEWRSAK